MAHLFFNTLGGQWSGKERLSNITEMRKVKHVVRLDRLNTVRSSKTGERM